MIVLYRVLVCVLLQEIIKKFSAFSLIIFSAVFTTYCLAAQETQRFDSLSLVDHLANETTVKQSRGKLEEVTVTARKKSENLQETPIAISALGEDALASRGINNVADLTDSVPGFEFSNSSGGPDATPFIRGVGQPQNKATLDPAVAMYMDDVYLGRPGGALMDIADIENIQVLRGPQGTLFGRNATGGAIVISPKKPTDDIEGMFLARTGSFNRQDIQVALNTPITDNFFTRFALGQTQRDGYITNLFTGTDDLDNEDRQFAFLQGRWLVGDYTTVDANFTFSKVKESAAINRQCVLSPESAKPGSATAGLGSLSLVAFGYGNSYKEACNRNYEKIKSERFEEFYNSLDPVYNSRVKGAGLTIAHEFETFDFKSVSSYREVDVETASDVDGTDLIMIDQSNVGNPHTTTQITQEFQFNGNALEGDLDYTVGAYYWQDANENGVEVTQTGPWTLAGSGIPFFSIYRSDLLVRETANKSVSLFGQATYHATDHLDITAGLRFTKEDRKLSATRLDNLPANDGVVWADDIILPFISGDIDAGGSAFGGFVQNGLNLLVPGLGDGLSSFLADLEGAYIYVPTELSGFFSGPEDLVTTAQQNYNNGSDHLVTTESNSFKAWTPMISVNYFFPDHWLDALDADSGMMYFTVSKGFRAGGVITENTIYDSELQKHYATLSGYEPESILNYEFGAKADLFGKLRVNTALFLMKYTNQQTTEVRQNIYNPLQVEAKLSNVGASTIAGLELETTYLPTDKLSITLNLNWTRSRYDTYLAPTYPSCDTPFVGDCGFGTREDIIDRSNEDVPNVVPIKVYLGADYKIHTPFFLMTPRLNATYRGRSHKHFDRGSWESKLFIAEPHTIYNARLTFDFYNEKTRVALGVDNLTDKRVLSGGSPIVDTLGGGSVSYNRPRMWTAEIVHKF